MFNSVIYLLFGLISFHFGPEINTVAIEICDNGIDDDGDGLIDLNDPDCKCKGIKDSVFVPSSLIPNPSFEKYTICPDNVAQLDRSVGWIQASPATSDYYNLCGYKDDFARGKPPQPLPAGRGYVGFLDIQNSPGRGIYKEYVGACLTSPMIAGKQYTLTYWVGFGSPGQPFFARNTLNMAIFGTSDCKYLPFAQNPQGYLCPTRYPGWFEMSRVTVSGRNQWKKIVVKLKPTVNVSAICLGPACATTDGSYYFWMDELILEETVKFDSLQIDVSGNPCTDTVILSSSKSSILAVKYQWYKDGIAISGAVGANFNIPKGAQGTYVLKVSYGNECDLSKPFSYSIDQFLTEFNSEICAGDSLVIAQKKYTKSGLYYDTLQSKNGCDSIIKINLNVFPIYQNNLSASICQGMKYTFDGLDLDSTGLYTFNYFSNNGCDSIVYLDLLVKKMDTTSLNFEVCVGEQIIVAGKNYFAAGNYKDLLINSIGCDSLLDINIIEKKLRFTKIDSNICDGSFVTVGSNSYIKTGLYLDTLTASNVCDSIVQLNLKVNPLGYHTIDTVICQNSFVEVFGKRYNSNGQFTLKGSNVNNCDSIIQLNLKVNSVFLDSITGRICDGDFFPIGNQRISNSGRYNFILSSQSGCDSTIILNLTVDPIKSFNLDTTLCFNEKLKIGTKEFDKTGIYNFNEKSSNSCDSLVNINLRINTELQIADSVKNLRCFGDRDGFIQTLISGGTSPYTIVWSNKEIVDKISNLGPGRYSLEIVDQLGCIGFKEYVITEPECFCFSVQGQDGTCADGSQGRILISQKSGSAAVEILLNGKLVLPLTNQFDQLAKGQYELEISDALGCKYYKTLSLDFDQSYLNDSGTDTIFAVVGDSIDLIYKTNNINSILNNQWSGIGVQTIVCNTCQHAKVVATLGENLYTYVGLDENGCEYLYKLVVVAKQGFFVPNVFSPNGDGINDYFNLISDSSIGIIDRLQIFDRWGSRLFDYKEGIPNTEVGGWDGTFKGRPVNPAVFVYLINFRDKTNRQFQLQGDLTLMR
ncbi:MAG: gliding motility-associated C-terminal domain-containing protein [Saprospiraceae bacterium]